MKKAKINLNENNNLEEETISTISLASEKRNTGS